MIAVCGELEAASQRGVSAAAAAVRAAAAGAGAQVIGVMGEGEAGDARLLELAAAGVGHAAVLRGPPREIEAEDLDLALRYLPDVKVIVVVALPAAVVAAASAHAAWSGAALIVVEPGDPSRDGGAPDLAEGSIVLSAPNRDPDGTFAGFVGTLAAHLDSGATPADAWAATTRELAVDPV